MKYFTTAYTTWMAGFAAFCSLVFCAPEDILAAVAVFIGVALIVAGVVMILIALLAGDFIQQTMDRDFDEERL